MNARVLVISYFFPPDGGPGTQRVTKFCKYLWRFGWSPTVLTRTVPETRGRWDPEDRSLEHDIPSSVRVIRVAGDNGEPDWTAHLPVLDSGDIPLRIESFQACVTPAVGQDCPHGAR